MRLGEKQELFARLLPRLIDRAHELGFQIRMGEVMRGEQQAQWNATHCRRCRMHQRDHSGNRQGHVFHSIGIAQSLHCEKLAVDLNLFRGGRFLTSSESHRPLGEWWEQQHELCRWGGRFGDGNHYSLTHGGRK